MTFEDKELIQLYQRELEKCFILAQKLDKLNPNIPGAFTGSPSDRIERQMLSLYSNKDYEKYENLN